MVEIRSRAELFGWDIHTDDNRREDTFVYGPNVVTVDYNKDWTVTRAGRYLFDRINQLYLQETTGSTDKKVRVIAWLARFS